MSIDGLDKELRKIANEDPQAKRLMTLIGVGPATAVAMSCWAWKQLREYLTEMGKDPDRFPNAIATMYFYIAEEQSKAEQVVRDVLGHLRRPGEKLGERFLTGAVEQCAERLADYQAAGAQRVFLWPIADELNQITIFQEKVASLVRS